MSTHLDELLRIADGALLNAKARGRNRVHSARPIVTVVEGPTPESVPVAPESMV